MLTLLLVLPVLTQDTAPPFDFHVPPYLQLPATDGMTIMWETTQPAPSRVEYGPTTDLGQVKEAAAPVKLHQIRLDGLEAGTAYYYRVKSGTLASPIHRFRTAPPPGTRKWKAALYGDSRSNPAMHRRVVEQIAKHDVDLILHTGDIVLNGKNYASWRMEFFGPLAPIAGSVPWVSTIGNHERDSANYFSYAALPGNERHFSFDYGNAHFVGLDSNSWIPRAAGSPQHRWTEQHLKTPRAATWTFVYFHHPLFSAHARRGINALRWDWAPLFLDPTCKVDGVLTGHDHFYARNYRISRMTEKPHPVLFLTSAGGGAPLYPVLQRDYVAITKPVHHFTLMEFDGPQVTFTAIDVDGKVVDKHTLRKTPMPGEEICSYEVEEIKEQLRRALAQLQPVVVADDIPTEIHRELILPARFGVPVAGRLRWEVPPGWRMQPESTFHLEPGQPLRIPLHAVVSPMGLSGLPKLTIEFVPGKFRNRVIEARPFKLTTPPRWTVTGRSRPMLPINGSTAVPLPSVQVQMRDGKLILEAKLPDPEGKIRVGDPSAVTPSSRLVLMGEHVRLEVAFGDQVHTLALSPEQRTHAVFTKTQPEWSAYAGKGEQSWHGHIEVKVPLDLDRSKLRFNAVYYHEKTKEWFELRPTFAIDPRATPEEIPLWTPGQEVSRFGRLP